MMSRRVEDFTIGEVFATQGRTVGEGDIALFAGLVGDFTPIHVDDTVASASPHGRRIAHGPLAMSMAIGLFSQVGVLGESVIGLVNLTWDFARAVKIGDTLRAIVTIRETRVTSKPGRGIVKFAFDVQNQNRETVQSGVMTVVMKTRTAD
jgi:acyl dehydratase